MITAMRLSLAVGILLLFIKGGAAWLSGSVAVFSDAAESVVHVIAVAFALFSLGLSLKPADENHPYGHAKIAFFSSAFEGAMILAAAIFIIYEAAHDIAGEPRIHQVNIALGSTVIALVVNGLLGAYLLRMGKKRNSIVLEANGHHVLTDCYTSGGVLVGLALTWWSGWNYWDPICAIIVALNMGWAARSLLGRSFKGLMDQADPEIGESIERVLKDQLPQYGITYHALRHRNLGDTVWADVHLVFPEGKLLRDAHRIATQVERAVNDALGSRVHLTTHLESAEDHDKIHPREEDQGG